MSSGALPPVPAEFTAWLVAHGGVVALVAARALGLVWTAPALSATGVGVRFRLAAALALVPVVAPSVVPGGGLDSPPGAWEFGSACVAEALVGAALGWAAALVIAGARQAGEVVGVQAGLAPASLFDPEAGDGMTPLGHLYGLVALGVFLALDGPLALVRALAESYRVMPAGGGFATESAVEFAFGRVGEALALAVRGAAPAALALVLAGLALGLLGRASPSIQRAAMLGPVRSVLGLFLVGLSLAALAATVTSAWTGLFLIERG